jgi:ectoine hydroxylase-related dioxygenase (phytanoyl-CoA dioxygenase family)
LLGEVAVDFKDKINYKQPGGAGFGVHQDRLAYPGANRVMSLLVAIDPCTTESGCLSVAAGVHRVLPVDERGVVIEEVARTLRWHEAELAPGDVVCIDGLAPHSSDTNHTARPRRVLVASYAPASEGYTRERYYSARRDEMTSASARDGRFRISTLADFDGVEVPVEGSPLAACTHP